MVFNVNFSSATTVNQMNINNSANSVENVSVNNSASHLTAINSAKTVKTNSTTSNNSSKYMAAGAPTTVNGLTVAQMKDGVSRVQAFYTKNSRLPTYVSYGTRKISISTFQQNIATQGLKIITSVNGLTLTQMNDGISRVQAFYNKNGRLPTYVSYGTRKILISTFQQNVATIGLKINTTPVNTQPDTSSISALARSLATGSTSQYNTAVKIFNWVRDNIAYSFYYNTKYGASGTLISRTGNCVDTSHLLIALSRAAGITARYKSGYCQFSSGTWYGHVWANLYVNGKWIPADAISYRNSLGVINNWNTATFTLYGTYTTLPF